MSRSTSKAALEAKVKDLEEQLASVEARLTAEFERLSKARALKFSEEIVRLKGLLEKRNHE